MIEIYVYFNLMFMMSMVMFFFCLSLFYLDYGVMLEWMMMSVNSINIEVVILIDWMSLLFISVVFLISSMIMVYSSMYMSEDWCIKRFIYLVILFIFSMVLMILSPNIISILFGWDGLGLVSYCLVIYYQNYSAYNSGMVTVLCNRVGDIGLLMAISLSMMSGSWNLWMINGGDKMYFLVGLMLVLAAITKSAQIPFSTWLPMAMAAPTPVSALVHSSTLVTAGVYLMIRFNKFVGAGSNMLFFLSVLTMFMAGLMANVENDLKKIIALSTLGQLGLMMMILSLGLKMVAFYHLLTHAIFKSMLFMCAGIIIHLMLNNQDIRLFGSLNEVIPFTMMSFYVSSLALCGFPFLAGFYSKDYIMELVYFNQINILLLVMIILSLMFTVSYSFRVFYYMFFSNLKFYSYYNYKEDKMMNLSMMILVLGSLVVGSLLNWMFFVDFYLVYLKVSVKFLSLMLCLMGVILGIMMKMIKILMKFYYLNYYLSSMWYLNYIYFWIYSPFINLGCSLYEFDKMWVEFSSKDFMKYMYKFMKYNKIYKMYQFMYLYIIFITMLVLLY
uniref:NADH dehydrogenase subunit 5 n=1 Tax=Carebara diversa TaxID=615681 RepID=UPI001EDF3C59|nr:NADH dehydrogenase subunit 5 [Carebara diversa]UIO59238.1 NADH dehydrogenase subunit 5 [Carebara diversa]